MSDYSRLRDAVRDILEEVERFGLLPLDYTNSIALGAIKQKINKLRKLVREIEKDPE